MSNKTIGKLTSKPDSNGKHQLKCPDCKVIFRIAIAQDEHNGNLQKITCPACGKFNEPKLFIYEMQKEATDKIARDYAEEEIRKAFKGLLR